MAKKAKHVPAIYRSYRFIDKDPIIDRMRTALQESGKTQTQICEESGLAKGTPTGWFHRGVRKPQFCTVMAFMHACGVDLTETPYTLRNGRK